MTGVTHGGAGLSGGRRGAPAGPRRACSRGVTLSEDHLAQPEPPAAPEQPPSPTTAAAPTDLRVEIDSCARSGPMELSPLYISAPAADTPTFALFDLKAAPARRKGARCCSSAASTLWRCPGGGYDGGRHGAGAGSRLLFIKMNWLERGQDVKKLTASPLSDNCGSATDVYLTEGPGNSVHSI